MKYKVLKPFFKLSEQRNYSIDEVIELSKEDAQAMLQASDQSISKARGTIQDLRSFCVEIGLLASDGDSCFYKWEGNGWKNGTAAIKDWRMTIRSWKSAGYLPSQRNEKPKPKASVR